jgi:hypothetical protein
MAPPESTGYVLSSKNRNGQRGKFFADLVERDAGLRFEVAGGEASGAEAAFFFKQVIAVVVVNHPIERAEIDSFQKIGPAAIEPLDADDKVSGDRAKSPRGGGSAGPFRGFGLDQGPEPGDWITKEAEFDLGACRGGGPLSEPEPDHIEHRGSVEFRAGSESDQGVFEVLPTTRERRNVEEAEEFLDLGLEVPERHRFVVRVVHSCPSKPSGLNCEFWWLDTLLTRQLSIHHNGSRSRFATSIFGNNRKDGTIEVATRERRLPLLH